MRGKCLNLIQQNWITVRQASSKISPPHEIPHADDAGWLHKEQDARRRYVQNDLTEALNQAHMKRYSYVRNLVLFMRTLLKYMIDWYLVQACSKQPTSSVPRPACTATSDFRTSFPGNRASADSVSSRQIPTRASPLPQAQFRLHSPKVSTKLARLWLSLGNELKSH